MYNYNCRTCAVRDQCIEQSSNASSIKLMVYHAFENRTDTLATWQRLRRTCLLEKEHKQQHDVISSKTTSLSKRLQQARELRQAQETAEPDVPAAQAFGYIGLEEVDKRHANRSRPVTQTTEAVSHLKHRHLTGALNLRSSSRPNSDTEALSCWLTIEGSWRHITLPRDGTLILGRFDPNVGVPPDIDLTFEDNHAHLISRRHALITGQNGRFTIEDLGSVSGVFLNDKKLGFGPSAELKPGDRLKLGNVQLFFEEIPPVVMSSVRNKWTRHTLMVAATGQKYLLDPSQAVVIGRSDRHINFMPDIDLNNHGQIAQRVSRRHARILWRNGQPYVEDMGSGFGTRLQGQDLPLGEPTPLKPGDHIWLAGCVLAYDIEVAPVVPAQPSAEVSVGAYVS